MSTALVPVEPQKLTVLDRIRQWALPRPRTSLATLPASADFQSGGMALANQIANVSWPANAGSYRALAQTPWVHAAIDIRKDQLATAEYDIVQLRHDGRKNVRLAQRIRDLFETPNALDASFHSFVARLTDDLLTLDAAPFEIVRYPTGEIAELWPVQGERIAVNRRWDGSNPDLYRYALLVDGRIRETFRDEQMGYLMDNPRTDSPIGVSPVQILMSVIDAELKAQNYNKRMVTGAAPDGIFNIGESAIDTDVQRAKSEWEARMADGGAVHIIGGFKGPSWMPFRETNRDMQFREWVDLLLRCIAVVYGLSPMDLGITFDVNRSSADTQSQNSEDRGIRPLMDLFQRYFTRKVVWDESFGGRENNLAFRWTALNLDETLAKANINKVAMPGVGWKSINTARLDAGRPPIGELDDEDNVFNHIIIGTPKGVLDLNTKKYLGEEQLAELAQETAAAKPQPGGTNAGT